MLRLHKYLSKALKDHVHLIQPFNGGLSNRTFLPSSTLVDISPDQEQTHYRCKRDVLKAVCVNALSK